MSIALLFKITTSAFFVHLHFFSLSYNEGVTKIQGGKNYVL